MLNKLLPILTIIFAFLNSNVYAFHLDTHEKISDKAIGDITTLSSVLREQTGIDNALDITI